jgi:hypothetical protein
MNQKEKPKTLMQLRLVSLAAKKEEAPKAQPSKRLPKKMGRKGAGPKGRFQLNPGDKFRMLTLVRPTEGRFNNMIVWECRCDCGNTTFVASGLLRGRQISCGCWTKTAVSRNNKARAPHNLSKSREYNSWKAMRNRCLDSRHPEFRNYGGRGIGICDEWRDFVSFLRDMGERPENHSLDRIDSNKDYEPGNCRWATMESQSDNKRTALRVKLNGSWVPPKVASVELGLTVGAIYARCRVGKIEFKKLYAN